jgi:hypothetical protein
MSARERFEDALRTAGKYADTKKALCPAHDDNNASLSISDRRDGNGIVIKCHAGCDYQDVLAKLSMTPRDLFDDHRMREIYAPKRSYRYPDGRVVHRKPDKSFPQSGNTKGNSLFHADRIGDAETVYWAEGEKDVEAIEAVGGVAVCSAMGAGNAKSADVSPLRGKHIIVAADKDGPGRKHGRQVAELVKPIAASVRVVEAAVGKDAADHIAAGLPLDELVTVESEDGAALLDDVEDFAGRFLALPTKHHLVVICLWILHTWAITAFYITPRLILESPEWGSGKTRVLEVLDKLCHTPRLIVSTSPAALFRRIDAGGDHPPTILQDEADAIWSRGASGHTEELRALYDNGYRRGAFVDRCVGDAKNMDVRAFNVFAPVALAGLEGKIPRTITSRGISMHMRRRLPDEELDDWRERDVETDAAPVRDRSEAWAEDNLDALGDARPVMPEGVRDRRAEVWEALLAIADAAGGDWPERARDACEHFERNGADDKLSLGSRLLRDIKTVFGEGHDRMHSAELVAALAADPESEWRDLWGKPLDQRRLAKELKRYGVKSNDVRIGDTNKKGYQVDGDAGLGQAWLRYLPSVGKRDKRYMGDIAGQTVADMSRTNPERDERDTSATPEIPSEQVLFGDVADVADVAPINGLGRNGHQAAAPEQNAAYRNGLCIDCKARPPSAGRTRCDECHRIHINVMAGYQ